MKIGVFALQGSYEAHQIMLERMGISVIQVRRGKQLADIQGLIIPGGETTTYLNLLEHYSLFNDVEKFYRDGGALYGTCAGAILLGKSKNGGTRFGYIDAYLERNAYGRQVNSFSTDLKIDGMDLPFEAFFIRAPVIRNVGENVNVLAVHNNVPVMVHSGRILLTTFHPELTDDDRVHRYFVEKVAGK